MPQHRRETTAAVSRRRLFDVAATLAAGLLLAGIAPAFAQSTPLKIGIIGTGRIGGALATHWVKAGHEVLISSRHPEELTGLAKSLGPRARVGTPQQAAAFGDVVLVSVPYAAMPQIGKDNAAALKGKIVIDTSNPSESRDGTMALAARKKGAGIATAEFLPGTRVVRAFNCIPAASLANDGNRKPERYAIPIGGDDAAALEVAQRLVRDAGFDPVVVGSLARTREFDLGQPLASKQFTAAELRKAMAR
jgi:predicted dinucleotide-binding enzyme